MLAIDSWSLFLDPTLIVESFVDIPIGSWGLNKWTFVFFSHIFLFNVVKVFSYFFQNGSLIFFDNAVYPWRNIYFGIVIYTDAPTSIHQKIDQANKRLDYKS